MFKECIFFPFGFSCKRFPQRIIKMHSSYSLEIAVYFSTVTPTKGKVFFFFPLCKTSRAIVTMETDTDAVENHN